MSQSLCRPVQAPDSLSRDQLLHVADPGGRLAVKIAIGALLGLLLAIIANLTDEQQPIKRLTLPAEAPPAVAVDDR